jgi:hypothetical protein
MKMGAVPAKKLGASPSGVAASDFNGSRPAEKLEFNLWRVDAQFESVWAAFGHVHLMQAARCRAYGCSIYTVHLLKMERDEPVPCNAILYVPGEEMQGRHLCATSTGRALNAGANFPGEPLYMRWVPRVFRGHAAASRRGEHPG